MQNISIIDYILLPIYLYIFYLIVRKRSVKYTDAWLRKALITAFFLRMLGSVGYSLMVQYYYGYGDAFTFYYGSNFFRGQILENPGNIKYLFSNAKEFMAWFNVEVGDINYAGYFGTGSNLFIMKIATLVSFFSFNSFLVISLFFGLFSFAGQWKMFTVFNEINIQKHQRLLAWAVLYTPSIWFWGSGLMKDSICLGCMGFIIYFLYKIFVKKQARLKDLVLLFFLLFVVMQIKSYIIIILGIALVTIIFANLIASIKNFVIRAFVLMIFLFSMAITAFFTNFNAQVQSFAEEYILQIDNLHKSYEELQNAVENSEGGIVSINTNITLQGIILQSPWAIFSCLYRPFIWESRKIIILLTSLESMLLFFSTLFVIFRTGFFKAFKLLITDRYILFSFIAATLFALLIGLTTFNFGTMIRYKIILLPFYYFLLVRLYCNAVEDNSETVIK
ncbi:MAG TPA: hypothetical protein PK987_07075 [Ferruginibacter sp.]|nr:hypothetical protein [Ferruginibacter sp.]